MNNDDYAIVIGIRYPRLSALTATLKDAVRFCEWLRSPTGGHLPDANIKQVISPEKRLRGVPGPLPIRDQIDEALGQILANPRITIDGQDVIGRRLYFYFSGHGFGADYNDVAMLMADAATDALGNNIGLQNYLELLHTASLFTEIVAILDCCRDSNPPRQSIALATSSLSLTPAPIPPVVDNLVVLAANDGRKSYEITPKTTGQRTGILTSALLTCLTDNDLADADGRFTTATVKDHLPGQVEKLAKTLTGKKLDQAPRFFDLTANHFVFATVPIAALAHRTVRIVAPPGLTGELILSDGAGNRIEARKASDAVVDMPAWNVTLVRNQMYSLLHLGGPGGPRVHVIQPAELHRTGHVVTVPTG